MTPLHSDVQGGAASTVPHSEAGALHRQKLRQVNQHERRIRVYLGFERFDSEATIRLERRLAQRAEQGVPPDELVDYADGLLRVVGKMLRFYTLALR